MGPGQPKYWASTGPTGRPRFRLNRPAVKPLMEADWRSFNPLKTLLFRPLKGGSWRCSDATKTPPNRPARRVVLTQTKDPNRAAGWIRKWMFELP